ncbi:DNA translocase FtsK [Chlamydia avium]|uniref:FtsK/SpoIIIE family protein n=1 Tax=Chlamydia avium TaxID=1457141 RepID=A0ABN0MT84_9CHLA|nr:DNA translocase FtsK [Chlamydia avium]EPP36098.1 ftsK/SpoIIIE family protein [Chlamydia psittaci 10_743_SC13]EPP38719.1 ftsK/SpoIIIE family protein [Chlamydia avium]VVT43108.1 DNA translocase FtsK [Chlamydia avium]
MAKEQKKSKCSLWPSISCTVKASAYLFLACFSGLSLWSFHNNQPCTQNWIGLLGWSLSSFLLYSFGIASFLIPLHFLWLSFLNFKNTPARIQHRKALAFASIPVCSSILLSMLSPVQTLPQFLDSRLPKIILGMNPPVSYLGGIPFYILYSGQSFCLKHLIGSVGTALIFSFVLFFSIFYLCGGIVLIKKKILQRFLKNKLHSFRHFCTISLKKLLNKQNYLPKPSLKVPSSAPTKTHLRSFPIPTVSLPIKKNEQMNYQNSSNPEDSATFLLTPHPQKRVLPPTNRIQFPSSESKILVLPKSSHSKVIQPSSPSPVLEGKKSELPQYHLLSKSDNIKPETLLEELQKKAVLLQQTLESFGIEAVIGNISFGPTLAAFEVQPNTGVKVQKIKALENDIALNLQASSIRIIAPIPGKAAVGIEIPNPYPQPVNFRDLLEDYQKHHRKLQIPLLLGKKANGENFLADLATMPHLIIAGTTGSGKSVCINTIVMSLIMTSLPSDIKLVIVDPKKVELTGYSQLPHMLTPVITEARDAYSALNWLVKEMELRYEILRFLGLRNIQAFNSRERNLEIEASYDKEIPDKMPFIVGIIDELADLLLSSSQDIETPIIRLAQMARAVGIHLILATQRPSRDVITGLIKANFPSRIAFKVANKVNSQIIIDEPGAENLMGNGDMLVVSPSSFGGIRLQGAYICDEDINKVVKDLCSRFPTKYVIPSFDTYENMVNVDSEERDPLYNQAKNLVLQTGNASTTFLQRKLKIGYARAASLIDQLEEARIIGPSEGAKPRQVLIQMPPQEG